MSVAMESIGQTAVWFDPDDPVRAWYHSLAIVPETGPDGSPTASSIEGGPALIIQCGARVGPVATSSEALANTLAGKFGIAAEELILEEASIAAQEARLELFDGDGKTLTIARSDTSRMPPFQALFNATLMGEQADLAKTVLSGSGEGSLQVSYDLEVTLPAGVVAVSHRTSENLSEGSKLSGFSSSSSTFGKVSRDRVSYAEGVSDAAADSAIARLSETRIAGTSSASASYAEAGSSTQTIAIQTDAARWFARRQD